MMAALINNPNTIKYQLRPDVVAFMKLIFIGGVLSENDKKGAYIYLNSVIVL